MMSFYESLKHINKNFIKKCYQYNMSQNNVDKKYLEKYTKRIQITGRSR